MEVCETTSSTIVRRPPKSILFHHILCVKGQFRSKFIDMENHGFMITALTLRFLHIDVGQKYSEPFKKKKKKLDV